METLVKSRDRVINRGEVFTPSWVVNAMLDLVKHEAERISSRFLEPACGNGNFLVEILRRKLDQVDAASKGRLEFERNLVLAVSSVYGIDILEDNVIECRERLFALVNERCSTRLGADVGNCMETVRHILDRNIVWGNALTMMACPDEKMPIVFSEWTPVDCCFIKRRDFFFEELVAQSSLRELPLFSGAREDVFVPRAVADYPPVHFLDVAKTFK